MRIYRTIIMTSKDTIQRMTSLRIKKKLLNEYKTTDKKEATHLLICGGMLKIPPEKLKDVYAELNSYDVLPSIVERVPSGMFRFFIDSDTETVDIQDVIDSTDEAFNKMFNIDNLQYTIYKSKTQNKYHVIYDVLVSKQQALHIVEFVEQGIHDELDKSVYNSGLRLPHTLKDKDKSKVYEYYEGVEGNIYDTASILKTENVKVLENTEQYERYLQYREEQKQQQQQHTTPADGVHINNVMIKKILNDIFNVSCNWYVEKHDEGGYKLTHDGQLCLSDGEHQHTGLNHSCMFINKKVCNVTCFSHGTRKLNGRQYKKHIENLRRELGLTKTNTTQQEHNKVDLTYDDLNFMKGKMNTTHEDVVCVFHRFYSYKYVCAGETPKPSWYEYKDGLWHDMQGVSSLRKDFTTGLIDIYSSFRCYCINEAENADDDDVEELISMASICDEVILKLKSTGYTDSLCKQAIHHFIHNDFIEELDKYRHLLCFGQDVYDLNKNEWRKTTKEDLCSRKCGITKDEITADNLEKLQNIINDIHPDDQRREFFINSLSDLLYGKNTKELFHIWTGTGRNGKGVISEILQKAFGDYYCSPSVSLITQKRASSNSANPELADTRGARIVMFTEPEENSRLNNSIIKQYTGGDELTVRKLFCNPFTFTPHFTPIIQCNTFQMQDVKDESIPARLLFMKFKTSFVDEEPTMEWQRKKDSTIKEEGNIKKLAGAMLYLLLQRWKELSPNHTFTTPQSIIDDKNEFLDDNNNIKQFVEENIIFTDDTNDILRAKDLLSRYKEWLEDRGERMGRLTLRAFTSRMQKYMPEYKERYRPYVDGSRTEIRSVFIKCKENEEVEW